MLNLLPTTAAYCRCLLPLPTTPSYTTQNYIIRFIISKIRFICVLLSSIMHPVPTDSSPAHSKHLSFWSALHVFPFLPVFLFPIPQSDRHFLRYLTGVPQQLPFCPEKILPDFP